MESERRRDLWRLRTGVYEEGSEKGGGGKTSFIVLCFYNSNDANDLLFNAKEVDRFPVLSATCISHHFYAKKWVYLSARVGGGIVFHYLKFLFQSFIY